MVLLKELNVLVDFGFMNSLSVPNKYLEEAIRPIKDDFPLTYKMCWSTKQHVDNEIIVDSTTNEVICVILWEDVNNGLNHFAQIYSIEVNKKWRRGGIGSVILQEFMEDKDKICTTRIGRASHFFLKNGFKIIEDSPKYAYYIKETK